MPKIMPTKKELEARIEELEKLKTADAVSTKTVEAPEEPVSAVQFLWQLRNAFVNQGSTESKAGALYSVKAKEAYEKVFGEVSGS